MITQEQTNGHLTTEVLETELTGDHSVLDVSANGNAISDSQTSESMNQEVILDLDEIRATLEALLFVSQDPLTAEKLASVLEGVPRATIKVALQALQVEYDQERRGLQVVEVAGGFVMVTRPEQSTYIKLLGKTKTSTKLSRSALEALAIVSYKQPITRADIEKIRGVETSGVLRTLLDQKLIRIVGRQPIPGRPILYGTGKQFLQRFGLRDLRDLPPLKELKDLGTPEHLSLSLPFDTEESKGEPRVSDLSA